MKTGYSDSMEQWKDQGIVLAARAHGESGAVVSVLTEHHGRHAGYVRGGQSSRRRAVIEPGTLVSAMWCARVTDSLGTFTFEPERPLAAQVMGDPLQLAGLLSACALCDAALPDREGHPGLFHGLKTLLETMDRPDWLVTYVFWEIALLRELGFGLDLTRCAGGGDPQALAWISPKSGRAVSEDAAAPYKEKLLPLPDFLKPGGSSTAPEEILKGLRMNGHFLEHWVFAQHTHGVPEHRLRFQERMARIGQRVEVA